MTWLTYVSLSPLSLAFSRPLVKADGRCRQERKEKKKKTNANRLSKESNTLTARRCCRRQTRSREQEKKTKKKTTFTLRRIQLLRSARLSVWLFARETNKWPMQYARVLAYGSISGDVKRNDRRLNFLAGVCSSILFTRSSIEHERTPFSSSLAMEISPKIVT